MNVVRQLRLKAGLTQSLLAELAGTDAATISRYENGHRSPTLAMLDRLAGPVGLTVVVLFEPDVREEAVERTEDRPPQPSVPPRRSRKPRQNLWTL